MTSITQALALYDMAGQIERLRFQLRALPPAPTIPDLDSVTAQVHSLAGILTAVSDQVSHRLGLSSADAKKAVVVYSAALVPLGEAMTELGRLQAEVTFFNFTTYPKYHNSPSDLERQLRYVNEIITGCRDAADEALEVAADELQAAAVELAHPPARVQAAAPARTPGPVNSAQANPAPAILPPAVAPRAAKSR
ncbi:hypothetical protein [Streptomyces rubradiris]|uniref:Uncharacterized protein n=1 Tax=Streptomyces rubradiris TaxID=285531 RepID=A0ABQ3RDT5_STRRR|nr:hypothetical protein [Streptomyces rubradiris]GHH29410.1 hypothetical protein GCM10018792_74450 [Streptomyces rubradiris]GHI53996.1 hypothetical protein Srubr_38420 [Streptomyces rubradiris]